MSKPNRYDIARTVGELSPATNATVAEALGADADSEHLKQVFQNAAKHGLIEESSVEAGASTWEISEKGKRKVAEKS
jgi:hypothetical protein